MNEQNYNNLDGYNDYNNQTPLTEEEYNQVYDETYNQEYKEESYDEPQLTTEDYYRAYKESQMMRENNEEPEYATQSYEEIYDQGYNNTYDEQNEFYEAQDSYIEPNYIENDSSNQSFGNNLSGLSASSSVMTPNIGIGNDYTAFQKPSMPQSQNYDTYTDETTTDNNGYDQEEKVGFATKLFSVLIPLVGIVLFFIYKNTQNKKAKTCLKCSFVGIGLIVLIYIVHAVVMSVAWNGVSEEIVERTCKMTGEEYTAFKDKKTGEYYCCIGETKELNDSCFTLEDKANDEQ